MDEFEDGSVRPSVSGGSPWSGLSSLDAGWVGGPAADEPRPLDGVGSRGWVRWAVISLAGVVLVGGAVAVAVSRAVSVCDSGGAASVACGSPVAGGAVGSRSRDGQEVELLETDSPEAAVGDSSGSSDSLFAGSSGDVALSNRPAAQPRQTSVAPRYIPSDSETAAAQAAVDAATERYQQLQVNPAASDIERRIAVYELKAALQRQADLEAGVVGAFHPELEVEGARAYLAAAEEFYRWSQSDPAATDADRAEAVAAVKEWQERLDRLLP